VSLRESVIQHADSVYDALQPGALFSEALRFLGIVPDIGVFQLAQNFLEALALRVDVKDTPSERPRAPACP
jgi:hypothetical protein